MNKRIFNELSEVVWVLLSIAILITLLFMVVEDILARWGINDVGTTLAVCGFIAILLVGCYVFKACRVAPISPGNGFFSYLPLESLKRKTTEELMDYYEDLIIFGQLARDPHTLEFNDESDRFMKEHDILLKEVLRREDWRLEAEKFGSKEIIDRLESYSHYY